MDNKNVEKGVSSILLTGATGFVGRHLRMELEKTNYSIRCLEEKSENESHFLKKKVEIFRGDIRDKRTIIGIEKDIDIVIHLANIKNGKSWRDYYDTNVVGTVNLVEQFRSNKRVIIIFISSANVELAEKNWYSRSKILAESAIINSGLSYIIIRPTVMYGPNDNGTIFKIIQYSKNHVFMPFAGNGTQKIQPLYVMDLVALILKIIKEKSIRNKIYSLGGMDVITYKELINRILILSKKNNVLFFLPFFIVRLIDLLSSLFSQGMIACFHDKLKTFFLDKTVNNWPACEDLGFSPTSLEEGLQKTIRVMK